MTRNPRSTTAHRGRRGANAVEFALVLPALLALLFGIVETSTLFGHELAVTEAALSSVRLAAMVTEDDVEAAEVATAEVRRRLAAVGIDDGEVEVTIVGDAAQRTVRVDVAAPYEGVVGFIPGMPKVLRASASMRMEGGSGS